MRYYWCFGLLLLGVAALILSPAITEGQPGGKGNKGGGKGFGGGNSMFTDPGGTFDKLANGRSFVLISEIRSQSLPEFAKSKGITNGQINKAQYLEWVEQV